MSSGSSVCHRLLLRSDLLTGGWKSLGRVSEHWRQDTERPRSFCRSLRPRGRQAFRPCCAESGYGLVRSEPSSIFGLNATLLVFACREWQRRALAALEQHPPDLVFCALDDDAPNVGGNPNLLNWIKQLSSKRRNPRIEKFIDEGYPAVIFENESWRLLGLRPLVEYPVDSEKPCRLQLRAMRHIDTHKRCYRDRRPPTMQPRYGPYAWWHFQEMVRAAELQPDERGHRHSLAGMGRFSRLLAQRPGGVTPRRVVAVAGGILRAEPLAPHLESRVLVSNATITLPAIPCWFDLVPGFFFCTTLKDLRGGETTQNPLDSVGSFFKHARRNSWRVGCVSYI